MITYKISLCAFFLLTFIDSKINAAEILISPSWINPVHRYTMRELAEELVRRNHTVTWFEYGLFERRKEIPLPAGVKEVFVAVDPAGENKKLRGIYQDYSVNGRVWEEQFWNAGEQTSGWLASLELCDALLAQANLRERFEKLVQRKFEAIVIDDLYNPCGLLLTGLRRSDPPFVYWSMTGLRTESAWANQSPSPPSYIPVPGTGFTDELNFWQRTWNLANYLQRLYVHQHIVLRRMDALFQAFYMERNASINFVNHPPIFDFARPYMPRVNFVGGLQCRKAEKMTTKISPKLETFVDSASNEHGFILITTGFSNHWATAPDETVNNMLEAIRAQPEKRFVWQYNSPTVLKNTPKNLYVDGWLAQQNLLAHPKCRAHVSHGGLNSVIESIWHGVPVIGWPLTSAGYDNLLRVTARQAGIMLDTKNPSKQQLISAMTRIYINFYKEEALLFQDLLIDVPYTELNHSAFWVEFIVRHQEVPHARSGADDLNVIQYFLVDVIAFVVAALICAIYLVFFVLKFTVRFLLYLVKLPFRVSARKGGRSGDKVTGAKKKN